LSAAEVRYLIVGAYAVTFHARPRFTKDLDVWIEPEATNAERVWRALAAFGAPVKELETAELMDPELVFQVGLPPNRIDILASIEGLEFAGAWSRRVEAKYDDCTVWYLGKDDLILSKRAMGRPQDLEDVRALEGK
jgi:hypothetical protein